MPRGKKKGHKGGHRHFTNEEQLSVEAEKARKQKEWRTKMGIESDEEEGDEKEGGAAAGATGAGAEKATGADRGLPPSSSSEEETDSDEEEHKAKGVQHLIEVENPNRLQKLTKKVSELGEGSKTELSRREREEIEKQRAKEHYQKMHLEGKTDEARADMARLALIRKQREDAARKRDEERKVKDDAKTAAEKKLLERKSKAGK